MDTAAVPVLVRSSHYPLTDGGDSTARTFASDTVWTLSAIGREPRGVPVWAGQAKVH